MTDPWLSSSCGGIGSGGALRGAGGDDATGVGGCNVTGGTVKGSDIGGIMAGKFGARAGSSVSAGAGYCNCFRSRVHSETHTSFTWNVRN